MSTARKYEVWCEGYRATGEHGTAHLVGTGVGETFDDAVRDLMSRKKGHGIEPNTPSRYIDEDAYANRRSNWSIWGCDLFDNEAAAKEAFG